MAKQVCIDIELHRASVTSLVFHLTRLNQKRLARAMQSFLLSKSILLRRQAEIEERIKEGRDTSRLEQMAARLQKSMLAHKRVLDALTSEIDER